MKAQAEIIGIAIIALLVITLIMLAKPQETEVWEEEQEIAALTTLLRTSVTCEGANMQLSDLLRGCVKEDCSCRDLMLITLLQGSFQNEKYDFEIVKNGESIFRGQNADCMKKSIWLPSEENIEVRLGTC